MDTLAILVLGLFAVLVLGLFWPSEAPASPTVHALKVGGRPVSVLPAHGTSFGHADGAADFDFAGFIDGCARACVSVVAACSDRVRLDITQAVHQ